MKQETKMVYVLTLEGEPLHAYTSIEPIRQACRDWFEEHRDNYSIYKDFNWWLEDCDYTDEEEAWDDYVQEHFDNGTWGDYAWYDVTLD